MPDKPIQSKQGGTVASQVADRIRNSENVLVALSKNPSVDELSAALGLTFILDKMGKHATAIFSGEVPNAIEFLEPEKTFESNTNSLQDFIIALDKEKADHLRYKIEGDFVRVYVTPYKTTLSENDLEFSHGDFNVDLIIALNVAAEADLDSALSEYGRIKHDASSINISAAAPGNFADLEWGDPAASSVSEMVADLASQLGKNEKDIVDKSTATALLAGIVSATNRFSNEHTSAETMAIASDLMAAGADQQLISSSIPVDILTRNVVDANEELKDVEAESKKDESELTIERNEKPAPATEPEPKEEKAEEPGVEPIAEATPSVEPVAEVAPSTEPVAEEAPAPIETAQPEPVVAPEPQVEEPKIVTRPTPEPIGEPSIDAAPAVPDMKIMPAAEPEKDFPAAELPTIEAPAMPMHDASVPEDAVPVVPANIVNEAVDTPTTPPAVAAPFANIDPAQPPVAPMTVAEEPAPATADVMGSPLPMPGDGNILPPPPIPFDPGFDAAPSEPIMPAPVTDTTPELAPNPTTDSFIEPIQTEPMAPITPAVLQEEDVPDLSASPSVNGVNPVMQDQVYNDPGAFQIPGAA